MLLEIQQADRYPLHENKEHAGAAELEAAVLEQLRGILRAPGMIAEVVGKAVELDPTLDEAQVTVAMSRLV